MNHVPTRFTLWRGRALAIGIALVGAVLVEAFGPRWLGGAARAVAAYDLAAIALMSTVWATSMHANADLTRRRAAIDDIGRILMLIVVLVSVIVGLVASVAILGHGPKVPTANEKAVVYTLAIVALIIGWALIHTMYIFRYAHLYYRDMDKDGAADNGLAFPGTRTPNDFDFAYFSFVLGMTFQVSDVEICSSVIRAVALEHALISFAYNATIIAFSINILSGLLH